MGGEISTCSLPFSPSLCSCCTTLTGVSCHAWHPLRSQMAGAQRGRGKARDVGSFASLCLSLSLSRNSWNSTPTTTADHPLLHPPCLPSSLSALKHDSNPDTLVPSFWSVLCWGQWGMRGARKKKGAELRSQLDLDRGEFSNGDRVIINRSLPCPHSLKGSHVNRV